VINLEKLDAAIAFIEQQPQKHDQNFWFKRGEECGTTACLAGTVAQLDGWRPDFVANWSLTADYVVKDGRRQHVASVARTILGVATEHDDELVDEMFYEAENLADIKEIRDRLAAGRR
jgi:hypothetical protein